MTESPQPSKPFPRILAAVLVVAFLALHFALLLTSSLNKTATVDEFAHVPAGCWYWKTGDFTLSGLNPPLLKLWCAAPVMLMRPVVPQALPEPRRDADYPWTYGDRFLRLNQYRYETVFTAARLAVMLLSLLTGLVLFLWARRVYGVPAALLALFLFAVEPNVVANGQLATQDTGMMLAVLLSACFLYGLLTRGGWWRALLAGVFVGVSCLVKYSGLVFAVIVPVALIGPALFWRLFRFRLRAPLDRLFREGRSRNVYHAVILTAAVGAIAVLVVDLQYGFSGSFRPLDPDALESGAMKRLAQSPLGRLPVPVPAGYVKGFDGQMLSVEQGETINYLNGEWSKNGWWYYYLEALALKVPIPVLLLIALGLVSVFFVRAGDRAWAWVAIVTVAVFVAFHSIGSNKNIGLRYMLPVFPFLLMLAGRSALFVAAGSPKLKRALGAALCLLVLWACAESAVIYPDYLAYFNEFAGGPAGGPRRLLDSNIDWGQDLKSFADYVRINRIRGPVYLAYFGHVDPRLYGIDPRVPEPGVRGTVGVSVNYLYGMPYAYEAGRFTWLRSYKPSAVVGRTIYVYNLDGTP